METNILNKKERKRERERERKRTLLRMIEKCGGDTDLQNL